MRTDHVMSNAVAASALPHTCAPEVVAGLLLSSHAENPKATCAQVVITVGVAIASYGEITFVVLGVILQLASIATESTRLILVQMLLQVPALSSALPSAGGPVSCLTGSMTHVLPCLAILAAIAGEWPVRSQD